MQGGCWTKERVDRLTQLWSEGKTATAIAACLGGVSRAAVLGKVFRLRLCPPGAGEASAQPKDSALLGERRPGRPPKVNSATPRDDRPAQAAAPKAARGKSLLELTNDCCRWPHGRPGTKNFYFCGMAGADLEAGIPYCGRHMRRAYLSREELRERNSKVLQHVASPSIQMAAERRPFAGNLRGSRL